MEVRERRSTDRLAGWLAWGSKQKQQGVVKRKSNIPDINTQRTEQISRAWKERERPREMILQSIALWLRSSSFPCSCSVRALSLLLLSLSLCFWRWHKRSHDGLMIDVRVAVWPTALLPPPVRLPLSLPPFPLSQRLSLLSHTSPARSAADLRYRSFERTGPGRWAQLPVRCACACACNSLLLLRLRPWHWRQHWVSRAHACMALPLATMPVLYLDWNACKLLSQSSIRSQLDIHYSVEQPLLVKEKLTKLNLLLFYRSNNDAASLLGFPRLHEK